MSSSQHGQPGVFLPKTGPPQVCLVVVDLVHILILLKVVCAAHELNNTRNERRCKAFLYLRCKKKGQRRDVLAESLESRADIEKA